MSLCVYVKTFLHPRSSSKSPFTERRLQLTFHDAIGFSPALARQGKFGYVPPPPAQRQHRY